MADQFYVPQRNPPQAQFQPPSDLVNGYLNRQQQAQEYAGKSAIDLGQTYNTLSQQKLQNYLAILAHKSSAFEAGGPYLLNALYGNGQDPNAGQGLPPQQNIPQGTAVGQVPPDQSQQPNQPAQSQPGQPPQGSYASPIEASVHGMGHPDFTGMLQQAQQYQSMGKYGREQTQNLQSQGALAMLPQTAAKNDADIRAANAKFATPEQGAAIASGDPGAVAGAYGGLAPIDAYNNAAAKQMEVKKTVAGEISKQGPESQQIGQVRQLYTDLQSALAQNKPSLGGNVSGRVNQLTGGRFGSSASADVLNAANPLATSLNTILSRRFNSGEVQLLSNALIPQPMDTPDYAAKKMMRLNNMISAMESGNEQNVKNVANAITGGKINTTIMPTRHQPPAQAPTSQASPINSQAEYDALPNGTPYTWNGQPHVKGKS